MSKKLIIVGAGAIGGLTGLALSQLPLEIVIIEQKSSNEYQDNRNFAISAQSKDFFEKIGLWQLLKKEAVIIKEIRVVKDRSAASISFGDLGEGESETGYMLEASKLISIVHENLSTKSNVRMVWKTKCDSINFEDEKVTATLSTGEQISGELLIAADGKNSSIRSKIGIISHVIDHEQTALVFEVEHEKPHEFVGLEHFYVTGPLASLPTKNNHRSSIIWMHQKKLKNLLLSMNQNIFLDYFREKFGNRLGEVRLASEIKNFDLTTIYAKKYYKNRVVLVGDAAHSIHPIAGQGLNLGIRDVKLLKSLLTTGSNIKDSSINVDILEKYQKLRSKDGNAMIFVTSCCNRLFLSKSQSVSFLTQVGMKILEKSKYLKKSFANYAMGYRSN